ncbi:MAG: nuclear transport factor 2 family protein [Chloroflexota bacterium]
MYYRIVRQTIEQGFRRFNQGDPDGILSKFAPNAHFRFFGNHAMGANLSNATAIRAWFERILRLFPGIQITPTDLKISGMPWDTLVVAQLAIRATLSDGRPYENTAMQMLRLRWGKVIEDLIYEDTYILINELENMARQGIAEALAQPIADPA